MARLIELNGRTGGVKPADHQSTPDDLAFTRDIMLEQLEYLCDHMREHGSSDCSDCQRYLRVRSLLLEIFADPPAMPLAELTRAA